MLLPTKFIWTKEHWLSLVHVQAGAVTKHFLFTLKSNLFYLMDNAKIFLAVSDPTERGGNTSA